MRNLYFVFILILTFTSCNDYENQFRGQWQLKNIIKNGKDSIPESPFYYSFQDHVFQIKYQSGTAFGRYYKKNDSLCIIFEDSVQRQALFDMKYSGWTDSYKSFYIIKLTNNWLYLRDQYSTLKFHSY